MSKQLKNTKWFVTVAAVSAIALSAVSPALAHGGFGGGFGGGAGMGIRSMGISRSSMSGPSSFASKSLAANQIRSTSLKSNPTQLSALKATTKLPTNSNTPSLTSKLSSANFPSKITNAGNGSTSSSTINKVAKLPGSNSVLPGVGSTVNGSNNKVITAPASGIAGSKLAGIDKVKLPPGAVAPPNVGNNGNTGGTGGTGGTGTGGTGTGGTSTGTGGMGSGSGMGNGSGYPGGWYGGPFGGLGILPFLGGFGGYGGGYGGGGSYVSDAGTTIVNSAPAATPADTMPVATATPAASVQGVDLQLVDVRMLDNGDAAQQIGPRYRVTFRNAGSAPVDHAFNVAVMAADDDDLTANLPISESRITSVPTGDAKYVDVRLPASAFSMGRDSHSEFAKLFVFVDSHGEVNDVNRDNNAAGVDRTAVQPAT